MWRFNVRETEGGFTVIEMLVGIVMAGILATIMAPSFLGMYSRSRVNQSLTSVQGAILEGQRQAMRTSTPCTLSLNTSTPGVTGNCLTTSNRTFNQVRMRASATNMRFDIKGAVSNTDGSAMSQPITVVVSAANTNLQRCLVMSVPLGLIRTGYYTGTDTVESNCVSRNGS
jgi:prepilin-type N-terminal cleavage/methylation domain-containing protein